jgi:hypothetical protein
MDTLEEDKISSKILFLKNLPNSFTQEELLGID